MNTYHVAIFSYPIPACVHPTLSVVATLIRRGYRVTYVTSERFDAEVARLGAEVVRVPVLKRAHSQHRADALATDFYDLACRVMACVSAFYERNVPDLILYDTTTFAAMAVAKLTGAPAVRMSAELRFDEEQRNRLFASSAHLEDHREYQKQARRFLLERGIERWIRYDPAEPTLYYYLAQMQLGPRVDDARSLYAGRCAAERLTSGAWQSERRNGKHRALITTSTVYIAGLEYYKMCIEALLDLNYQPIVSLDRNLDVEALGPLLAECEIVTNVPQLLIMPKVDLLIGFGGLTTQMEAAYHGVPLLMLSRGNIEGEAYADVGQRHGLGIHLREANTNVASIKKAAADIVEGGIVRDQVRHMQAAVKASPGSEEAANWVEQHLRER